MSNPQDWTRGPAKWAAVAVLGAASIFGMAYSVLTRRALRPVSRPSEAASAEISPEPRHRAPSPAPTQPVARKVDLNTATAAQLELLPGIGPALAKRILDHRASTGPFRSIEQLREVKGIGERTLERLRPLVKVE